MARQQLVIKTERILTIHNLTAWMIEEKMGQPAPLSSTSVRGPAGDEVELDADGLRLDFGVMYLRFQAFPSPHPEQPRRTRR